jgi:hypothetical protein
MTADVMGWLAAALTLLTFSMRAMLALRVVGMAANVAFIGYGICEQLVPVIVLHSLLLPCNMIRTLQILQGGEPEPADPSR